MFHILGAFDFYPFTTDFLVGYVNQIVKCHILFADIAVAFELEYLFMMEIAEKLVYPVLLLS